MIVDFEQQCRKLKRGMASKESRRTQLDAQRYCSGIGGSQCLGGSLWWGKPTFAECPYVIASSLRDVIYSQSQ